MAEKPQLGISYARLLGAGPAPGKAARPPVDPQLADRRLAYVDACLAYHGYKAAIGQGHHL